MKSLTTFGFITLLLLTSGCSTVSVREPFGDLITTAERKPLEGIWANDDGETVQIHLSRSGDLTLGSLEWDDENDRFRAYSNALVATESRGSKFLHTKLEEGEAEQGYMFCRYDLKDEKTIELYHPVGCVFQQAVQSKTLQGKVENKTSHSDIRVDASGDDVVTFLSKSGVETCFENKPFVTFKRLKRFE